MNGGIVPQLNTYPASHGSMSGRHSMILFLFFEWCSLVSTSCPEVYEDVHKDISCLLLKSPQLTPCMQHKMVSIAETINSNAAAVDDVMGGLERKKYVR